MPTKECPLCSKQAEFREFDFGLKRKFFCDHCRSFVISPGTENKIVNAGEHCKEKISEASRQCEAGAILLIYSDEDTSSIGWRCESEQKWS